jgi:uncharacterized protein
MKNFTLRGFLLSFKLKFSMHESNLLSALDSLYTNALNRECLHSKPYTLGVVAAVCCSPEIPMPPEWMPWVFRQGNSSQADLDWEQITDALVKTLRDSLGRLREEKNILPESYVFDQANLDSSNQAQWLSGFLFAHQQLQPVWQNAWEHMQAKSLDKAEESANMLQHSLKVMSVLAKPSDVLAQSGKPDLADKLPDIAATLPRVVSQYAELANSLAEFLPNQFEQFTQL